MQFLPLLLLSYLLLLLSHLALRLRKLNLIRHGSEYLRGQGPPKLVEQQPQGALATQFVVVSPQTSRRERDYNRAVAELTRHVLAEHPAADPSRVYLTGVSQGGFGAWDVAAAAPHLFAAIAPICGGARGLKSTARALVEGGVAAWVFHGANDSVIPVKYSDEIVYALQTMGAEVKYSRYERAPGRDPNWLPQEASDPPPTAAARRIPTMEGHASWVYAYEGGGGPGDGAGLWTWLLEHRRGAGRGDGGSDAGEAAGGEERPVRGGLHLCSWRGGAHALRGLPRIA